MASAKRLRHQRSGMFGLGNPAEETFRQAIHDGRRRRPPMPAKDGDVRAPDRGRPRPQPVRTPSARFARDSKAPLSSPRGAASRAVWNSFFLSRASSIPLLKCPRQDFRIPRGLGNCLGHGYRIRQA